MNDIPEEYSHLFFMSNTKHNHTYYLHFRADIYIPIGCDYREQTSYGFMQEVRLEKDEVVPVSKEKVSLWTDMGCVAFEALITGIMMHNPEKI